MPQAANTAIIPTAPINQKIYFIPGPRLMRDADLAKLYGVTTSSLNQAVQRNRDRFPEVRRKIAAMKKRYDARFQAIFEPFGECWKRRFRRRKRSDFTPKSGHRENPANLAEVNVNDRKQVIY